MNDTRSNCESIEHKNSSPMERYRTRVFGNRKIDFNVGENLRKRFRKLNQYFLKFKFLMNGLQDHEVA